MRLFGLIGYPLGHSFSENLFSEKFKQEAIANTEYKTFPLKNISQLSYLIQHNPKLSGLNVTTPYKKTVIPFLNSLDDTAAIVGAVNTIKIIHEPHKSPTLIGYNTDVYGFREALKPFLNNTHNKALILGTGGGAEAVQYVLKQLGIACFFVSRAKEQQQHLTPIFNYTELSEGIINACSLIVNASPVGMFPNIENYPAIPYEYITKQHFLFDLVYNPQETVFLKKGRLQGAVTENGLSMLYLQAKKSWAIWNEEI